MHRFTATCFFVALGTVEIHAQSGASIPKWAGSWVLDASHSTLGHVLIPGAPADLKVVSQTLIIEKTGTDIRLSGDSALSVNSQTQTFHDDNRLRLDGTDTIVGPIHLSFRPIDSTAFEIVSKLTVEDRFFDEVSHYSCDGKTLTETKIQTERNTSTPDADPLRTSKSVLLFRRPTRTKVN
jgi:hypothetical protein